MRVRGKTVARCLLLIACVHPSQSQSLQSVVDEIRSDIASLVRSNVGLAAKFIRLAFHDAVGGGTNGCIDIENVDNNGLDVPIEALQPVVNEYATSATGLSRADIWVLAAMVGCEESQNVVAFPMLHFGRVDCDDPESISDCTSANGSSRACSSTTGPVDVLPSPDLTTSQLLRFFSDEFNFNAKETVAIMGAHTIGELARENSGFDGSNGWVDGKEDLDNEYYELLVGGDSPNDSIQNLVEDAPRWRTETVNNGDLSGIPDRFKWARNAEDGGDDLIMMNSDVAIVRDLENNLNGNNAANCRFSGNRGNVCPHAAATLQFAADYRFDNDLWLNDFRDAMTIMTNVGYSTASNCSGDSCLRLVSTVQISVPTIAPTSLPTPGPTRIPTLAPTRGLTTAPTVSPTRAPVMTVPASPDDSRPSLSPTRSPTGQPTKAPVDLPTEAPASNSTEQPTVAPTESPTDLVTPTNSEDVQTNSTLEPTATASSSTSGSPGGGLSTTTATTTPGNIPSLITAWPSSQPSRFPSDVPTDLPSVLPSNLPPAATTSSPTNENTAVGPDVPGGSNLQAASHAAANPWFLGICLSFVAPLFHHL